MARVASGLQQVQRDFDLTEAFIANRELAEIWVKGESDFDILDEVDRQRLMFFERRAIVWWHHTFQLHRRGLELLSILVYGVTDSSDLPADLSLIDSIDKPNAGDDVGKLSKAA